MTTKLDVRVTGYQYSDGRGNMLLWRTKYHVYQYKIEENGLLWMQLDEGSVARIVYAPGQWLNFEVVGEIEVQ